MPHPSAPRDTGGGLTQTQLLQCSVYGLTDTSLERMAVEAGMWRFLIDAAIAGPHVVTENIPSLVLEWKSVLGIATSIPIPLRLFRPKRRKDQVPH